jgi:hypothetical protein
MLLPRSVYENSNMDGSLNPAATENNYVVLCGDFAAGMMIVDPNREHARAGVAPVQVQPPAHRPAQRTFVVPHGLRRGDSERVPIAVDSDDGLTGRPRNAVPAGNSADAYPRPVQSLPGLLRYLDHEVSRSGRLGNPAAVSEVDRGLPDCLKLVPNLGIGVQIGLYLIPDLLPWLALEAGEEVVHGGVKG